MYICTDSHLAHNMCTYVCMYVFNYILLPLVVVVCLGGVRPCVGANHSIVRQSINLFLSPFFFVCVWRKKK